MRMLVTLGVMCAIPAFCCVWQGCRALNEAEKDKVLYDKYFEAVTSDVTRFGTDEKAVGTATKLLPSDYMEQARQLIGDAQSRRDRALNEGRWWFASAFRSMALGWMLWASSHLVGPATVSEGNRARG